MVNPKPTVSSSPPTATNGFASGGNEPTQQPASSGSGAKRKKKGSHLDPQYGRQRMKLYPVTEEQLENLFVISVIAAIFFSLAVGFFGFSIDVYKDLSFSQYLPKETKYFWNMIKMFTFILSAIFCLLGGGCVFFGHTKLSKIKKNTDFE